MWAQCEFDFGDIANEKPKPAPPRFENPTNDNERLLNYQYEYRMYGNAHALDGMYSLGRTVALKYINAKAQGNRRIAELGAEEKEEKAHNAITYIIARYLQVKEFCIAESFTAYLYLRVQHELFYRRKVDEVVRFVDMDALDGRKRNDN